MTEPREVRFVLPDLSSPSGGNVYDGRVADGLASTGWLVHRREISGAWPHADHQARDALSDALADVPDGGVVLIDGLVAGGVPEVIEPAARRLRLVVLVHLPLPDETGLSSAAADELADKERRALRSAAAVVVTSPWAATRLRPYGLEPARVHVVIPGTDAAPLARGTLSRRGNAALVCVGAVTPRKDQLTLVDALAVVADLAWSCDLVGPTDKDPRYASAVRDRIVGAGIESRIRLVGPLLGADLAAAYDAADLLVLVSRAETFGMVITEALARGVPVLTTAGGAAEETLGTAPDGSVAGLVVPPGDALGLAEALRRWLTDASLRSALATSARQRRGRLGSWDDTTRSLAAVLAGVPADVPGAAVRR